MFTFSISKPNVLQLFAWICLILAGGTYFIAQPIVTINRQKSIPSPTPSSTARQKTLTIDINGCSDSCDDGGYYQRKSQTASAILIEVSNYTELFSGISLVLFVFYLIRYKNRTSYFGIVLNLSLLLLLLHSLQILDIF